MGRMDINVSEDKTMKCKRCKEKGREQRLIMIDYKYGAGTYQCPIHKRWIFMEVHNTKI